MRRQTQDVSDYGEEPVNRRERQAQDLSHYSLLQMHSDDHSLQTFTDDDVGKVIDQIDNGINTSPGNRKKLAELKGFLLAALKVDPDERATAKALLEHKF